MDEPACDTTGICEPLEPMRRRGTTICRHCGAEMHRIRYLGWVHWSHPDLGLDAPRHPQQEGLIQ